MQPRTLALCVITCGASISSCEKGRQAQPAIGRGTRRRMRSSQDNAFSSACECLHQRVRMLKDLAPDAITYNASISARKRQPQAARSLPAHPSDLAPVVIAI